MTSSKSNGNSTISDSTQASKQLSFCYQLIAKLRTRYPHSAQWELKEMLNQLLGKSWVELFANDEVLLEENCRQLESWVQMRLEDVPLAHCLGYAEFMDMKLAVGKGVLIPRTETEILVQEACREMSQDCERREIHVLDLGTGSGNIALGIVKKESRAQIHAIEHSLDARQFAAKNIHRYGQNRVKLIAMDYLKEDWRAQLLPAYHFIVANPPYISSQEFDSLPQEVQHDPYSALIGGEQGNEILKFIIRHSRHSLHVNGLLMLEMGIGQSEDIQKCVRELKDITVERIVPDHQAIERVIVIRKISPNSE